MSIGSASRLEIMGVPLGRPGVSIKKVPGDPEKGTNPDNFRALLLRGRRRGRA
jgi:hypothetical protein